MKKTTAAVLYEGDSEDEPISRKRQWKQRKQIIESDEDSPPVDRDDRQRTKKTTLQAMSEILNTTTKPRFDALDSTAEQIKQNISENHLQTTKNAETIVKNTSKVAKLVGESKKEIRKVFSAVDTGHRSVKGKFDSIAKSSNDTSNKIMEKNERQAHVIAKLNAEIDRLHAKLEEKEQIILDRGLGNGRVVSRILAIQSTTQENSEKTDAVIQTLQQEHNELSAKYNEISTKLDTMLAILRTLVQQD